MLGRPSCEVCSTPDRERVPTYGLNGITVRPNIESPEELTRLLPPALQRSLRPRLCPTLPAARSFCGSSSVTLKHSTELRW